MPWCDACDRFYNPNSLPESAECPGCGQVLMKPAKLRKVKQGKGGGPDALAATSGADQPVAGEGPLNAGENGDAPPGLEAAPGVGVDDEKDSPVPWHFWILVVALVIYLGWRLVQLIVWLAK